MGKLNKDFLYFLPNFCLFGDFSKFLGELHFRKSSCLPKIRQKGRVYKKVLNPKPKLFFSIFLITVDNWDKLCLGVFSWWSRKIRKYRKTRAKMEHLGMGRQTFNHFSYCCVFYDSYASSRMVRLVFLI